MRKVMCFASCLIVLTVGLIIQASAQQRVPGAGPPSPQIAQPLEQQALQGGSAGLSGSAAMPHPEAGVQNPPINRNSLTGVNRNSGTAPNLGLNNSGPVQPIYQNSAAVSGPAGYIGDAGQAMPTDTQMVAAAQQRGQLGVFLIESGGAGVEIGRITEGSAASRAGLQTGDVILQVNGHGATSPDVAARMIRSIPAGEQANLTIWRDGNQQQVQVAMEPVRDIRQASYLGENNSSNSNGDLGGRMARLEQQLASVTEEVQRLQQELKQLRGANASSASFGESTNLGTTPGNSGTDLNPPAPANSTPAKSTTTPGAGNADDLFGPPTTPGTGKP